MRSTCYHSVLLIGRSWRPCMTISKSSRALLVRNSSTTSAAQETAPEAAPPAEQPLPESSLRSLRIRASALLHPVVKPTSEVPAALPKVKAKRTTLTNPADHTEEQEGFYYTVPPAQAERVFGTLKARERTLMSLRYQFEITGEAAVMIRQPGLEIMNFIKKSNMTYPAVRYVLYGRYGSGKTSTLAYLLHFFSANGWIVFHVPRIPYYTGRDMSGTREVAESTFKRGRIDLPKDSVEWLQHFLIQNGDILKDPSSKLLTHKTYVWSKREETPAGSRLIDVLELGIKRARYANDCIGVLVNELKLHAGEGGQKVGVVMDNVNALFTPTLIPRVNRTTVPPEILSLFCHFKSILRTDWTNGAIVTAVDEKGIIGEKIREDGGGNYLPRYLLRGAGWELMDPCVPVMVPGYKDKELTNCIDYQIETQWLQHEAARTDKGRQELKFSSGMNPGQLRIIVSRL